MRAALLGLALVLAGCASPPAPPDAPTVRAVGGGTINVFDPAEVEAPAGATVRWLGDSGDHTVTFERDVNANGTAPDSGNLAVGQTFDVAFPRAGTYRYRCIYHSAGFDEGMVGGVVVA